MHYFLNPMILKFLNSRRKSFLHILLFGMVFSNTISAQQTELVDFLRIKAFVEPNKIDKSVNGGVNVAFKILKDTDSVYLNAIDMTISEIELNAISNIVAASDKIWFIKNDKFKEGETYEVNFNYSAQPKQTLYFTGDQIWTQGQGKYTSHWLPSIDDVNDKIEFDLMIMAEKNESVIANGKLKNVDVGFKNFHQWNFDMNEPMSSYLVAFAIGNYEKQQLMASSGIPLELYYNPEDSLKFEPTYRYSTQIFDFLENEIGVPFPWQNYKQVPVRDFLYAGMENTTATFFSQAFMVDSIGFNDRNYINVNAHELAHQWFGNSVTAKTEADHWLQEGFATYYALLAERDIFGDEYYYWQLYQTAEQLKILSDEGKGESLLNPKASSLTFYQKGAWALHILKELVGEESFREAIKNYLNKYKYGNVSTKDFLNEVSAVSEIDILKFEQNWLKQSAFQSEEGFQSLMKSNFIKRYFEVSALRAIPLKDKITQLRNALTLPNDFIGQEAVYQLAGEDSAETQPLYIKALESNNLYVRQAVALSLQSIPKQLQDYYETLLNDASYVTLETALYQLWTQFPEKRGWYLDKTEGIEGFQNKNVIQLWLTLALITENYHDTKKGDYLKALKQYTSPEYSFEIREKAFEFVNELKLWDSETLSNLLEACVHHTWRFSKASREILKEVIKDKEFYEQLKSLENGISEKIKIYLNSITKE